MPGIWPHPVTFRFSAELFPSLPGTTSYCTRCPSLRLCSPARSTALIRSAPFRVRGSSNSVFDRVGFQVQHPRNERWGTCRASPQGCGGPAPHVSSTSLKHGQIARKPRLSCAGAGDSQKIATRPKITARPYGPGPADRTIQWVTAPTLSQQAGVSPSTAKPTGTVRDGSTTALMGRISRNGRLRPVA